MEFEPFFPCPLVSFSLGTLCVSRLGLWGKLTNLKNQKRPKRVVNPFHESPESFGGRSPGARGYFPGPIKARATSSK